MNEERPFEPGDAIFNIAFMPGSGKTGLYRKIRGYYGGRRSDGSVSLFLRDDEGALMRCIFPFVPDIEHDPDNGVGPPFVDVSMEDHVKQIEAKFAE